MIPSFRPGDTDINEYTKKLEFLASLWPPEHLSHLAPRAAMMCEGSSFKRVMRLDPAKLKVNTTDGVKLLVTTLGGIWGKSNLEEKFERFERAIYTTVQRADESHDSYMARHDFQFEELLQMGVSFADIRAYILLRNSGLGSEDKKKLIVDSHGNLEYQAIVSALKLLGSKFFHEVQAGSKFPNRVKTYDVNAVFDEDSGSGFPEDDHVFMGETWDESEIAYDDNDPDAIVCMQFEESLVDALQSDADLAACYNTYLDARKRINDRSRNRGFWGNSKGSMSQNKGKAKGKGKGQFRFRKPLAQRILESECRRCGAKGHWKAECPLNRASTPNPNAAAASNAGAFTGAIVTGDAHGVEDDMILVTEAPHMHAQVSKGLHSFVHMVQVSESSVPSPTALARLVNSLKSRLSPPRPDLKVPTTAMIQPDLTMDVHFVSHGPFGIVDLGASQTVIGQQQVSDLMQSLPKDVADQTQRVPCDTVFRFGNSSTVVCQYALLVPLAKWRVKICVVKSQTPFLISNNVFRTLGARIDTDQDAVFFSKIQIHMPLKLSEKKLYLLDFCELIRRSAQAGGQVSEVQNMSHMPIMSAQGFSTVNTEHDENHKASHHPKPEAENTSDHQPLVSKENQASVPPSPCIVSSPLFHGHVELGRSLSSLAGAAEEGRVHVDVLRRPVTNEGVVWGNQGQSDLSGSDRGRPKVCSVVCEEIPEQPERVPPSVPVLSEPLCGTQRTGEGTRDTERSPDIKPPQVQSQGQAGREESLRTWEPGILVRPRGSMGCDARSADDATANSGRDRGQSSPTLQHGGGPDPDHAAAPTSDPSRHGPETGPVDLNSQADGLRTLMCDSVGVYNMNCRQEETHDPVFFNDEINLAHEIYNWVDEEMWMYFQNKYPH